MKIIIKVGDVLSEPADVLISTANPWLNLSGGVNGAIREAVVPVLKKSSLENLTLSLVVRREDHAIDLKETLCRAGVMVTG
jgi:O-acetyl-ADP-ribose deacetylase (regulator of RNase III)